MDNTCAPTDRPEYIIAMEDPTCGNHAREKLSVELWILDLVPGTFTFPMRNGRAKFCTILGQNPLREKCELGVGTLTLESVTDAVVSGTYQLEWRNGDVR